MKDKDKFQYLRAYVVSDPQIIPEVNGSIFGVSTDYHLMVIVRLSQRPLGVGANYPNLQRAFLCGNSLPNRMDEIEVFYSPSEDKYFYEWESWVSTIDEKYIIRTKTH